MPELQPEYVLKFKETHKGITRLGIERSILRMWKPEWSQEGQSPYGLSFAEHFCEYVKEACPKIDLHDFFVDQIKGFEKTYFLKGRQILNVIGSKNSGKTDFFATFALCILSIYPEYTTVYVAAPYMTAADSTVWGRVLTRMMQMKEANPELWAGAYEWKAKNRVVFESHAETGFCELRTLDKIGKLQGTKSYSAEKGWLILLCDEIALFPTRALLDLLDNLTGNDNFFCFTGCNFKNTEGLEGDLCRPDGREYSELDIEADQEWDSAYKSYTVRLDGHYSPNILAGETKYKYLLSEKKRKSAEEIHGLMGPKYLEQIRSFPNNSMADFFVTSREKIRAGGGWDDFVFDIGQEVKVGACDPGFGGDPCKIGAFSYCNGRIQDSDGNFHTVPLFMPLGAIETIPLVVGKVADQDWIDRVHKQIQRKPNETMFIREGQEITMEQQIVVQAGEFLDKWGIPRNNFAFDGSMRAGISTEFVKILGNGVTGLDFGDKATQRMTDLTGKKEARDLYGNYVTEMYFNFARLVQSGQFRGAELIPGAITQICRRSWKPGKNDIKHLETKADYKKANQGKSPDDSDVLVMGLEEAQLCGFMDNPRGRPSTLKAVNSVINLMRGNKRFMKRTSKALNA
jgi:hypothetical protein